MVDFLYFGEANVYQENLDSFLAVAEELQLKGLMGSEVEEEAETTSDEPSPDQNNQTKSQRGFNASILRKEETSTIEETVTEEANTIEENTKLTQEKSKRKAGRPVGSKNKQKPDVKEANVVTDKDTKEEEESLFSQRRLFEDIKDRPFLEESDSNTDNTVTETKEESDAEDKADTTIIESVSTQKTPPEGTVAVTVVADVQDLDEKIKSMMEVSENKIIGKGRARICKMCGKEGQFNIISNHIESHHTTGVSHTCNICGKICKTRNFLAVHKSKNHRNQTKLHDQADN